MEIVTDQDFGSVYYTMQFLWYLNALLVIIACVALVRLYLRLMKYLKLKIKALENKNTLE
ncbi:hypothetical protein [Psychroserpens jangbogonensis]|uniref:hypothetical protein n=1 Tax=Psychroserpens jangbogonensis TaxID=1484460 RepID=UPI00053D6E8C|nr:hypothetical protein [Psychroserpens jangbogonensis]